MAPARIDPAQDAELIHQLAAQQLGGDPAMPDPAMAPPPDPAADPNADNPATNSEKLTAAMSPKTEGDNAREEAFIEVDLGNGEKEVLSASQIAGLKSRYRDLNFKHMGMKDIEPAVDLIKGMVESARAKGQEVSGPQVAEFLQSAIQAFVSNPTMGQQPKSPPARPAGNDVSDDDFERELAEWERDNAVSVPPMYRNAAKMMNQIQAENAELKQAVTALLQQAGAVNQEAGQQVEGAQSQADAAYRQQASNNLNMAQQQLGLPDDASQDFFDFAFGRGYTVEDFIDRDLTMRIMQDFAANRATPEMERLRALNARRQAFTGAVAPTPAVGGAPAAASPDDALMQQMAAAAMAKRGR